MLSWECSASRANVVKYDKSRHIRAEELLTVPTSSGLLPFQAKCLKVGRERFLRPTAAGLLA